jgi:hypothetical protein
MVVHLMGTILTGMRLRGIYFMGMHLIGMHLTGVCLMGVYLMGARLHVTCDHAPIPLPTKPGSCVSALRLNVSRRPRCRCFCNPVLHLFTIYPCTIGTVNNSCADLNSLSFWMVNVTDSLTY